MDNNKAYLIEDLKIKILDRRPKYYQVVEPEMHPWKPEKWIEPIELQTIELPLRTITVNNGSGEYKKISFYYNSEVDQFLGRPFDTIRRLENSTELLQKQITKLSNQIITERKEADTAISQYKELNNKLMSKTFWQKLKELF